jgi:N-acetylglucosamine-6-sulfatase
MDRCAHRKLAVAVFGFISLTAPAAAVEKPNIIVVMTDDMDDMDSITPKYMPAVSQLAATGIRFTNSFLDFPVCGPSRASFLSGQSARNTGIKRNFDAWTIFKSRQSEQLGTWLQTRGYRTAFIGKMINGYGEDGDLSVMPGWNEWRVFEQDRYYNYTLNENGTLVKYGSVEQDYSTSVLEAKAVDFLKTVDQPFFLYVAPKAPHTAGGGGPDDGGLPIPAPKDLGRFALAKLPERRSFNERNVSDKPSFIQEIPLFDAAKIAYLTALFRARRASTVSVDRMVEHLREVAPPDTYFIFTSDNGYSMGDHRWITKGASYEASARAPLIIAGPGVPAGERQGLVNNLDLTATILDLAGARATNPLDGRSLLPLIADASIPWRSAVVLQGQEGASIGLRGRDYLYVEYRHDAPEFYDLTQDPDEMRSRPGDAGDAPSLLNSVRDCVGDGCWVP